MGVETDTLMRGHPQTDNCELQDGFTRQFTPDDLDIDALAAAIRELLQPAENPANSQLLSSGDRVTHVVEDGTP